MLMALKTIRAADVVDGTSNTLFVGEVTGDAAGTGKNIQIDHKQHGFIWPEFSNFSTYHGINGPGSIPGSGTFNKTGNDSFSSYHPGGCHFLLVDGSVTFISQNVNQPLLTALTTRNGANVHSTAMADEVLVAGPP